MPVVMEIVSSKAGRDIGDYSVLGRKEREVLFPPRTRFRIVSRDERMSFDVGASRLIREIHLKLEEL